MKPLYPIVHRLGASSCSVSGRASSCVDTSLRLTYSWAEAHRSKEADMAHGRDKPGREKRKVKKEKSTVSKETRNSEVLQHVAQHDRAADERV
jgi:hypothetical protein